MWKVGGAASIWIGIISAAGAIGGMIQGEAIFCVCMGIAATFFFYLGIRTIQKHELTSQEKEERARQKKEKRANQEQEEQVRQEQKKEEQARREQKKEEQARSLACTHAGGLSLKRDCACSIRFDGHEILITGGESVIHLPYEKTVSMKIECESTIERYYGHSISGALIGGAAMGPIGAGLLGVKEKKRRKLTFYLTITYNPAEGRVSTLLFRLPNGMERRAEKLVKQYLPLCRGQKAEVTL